MNVQVTFVTFIFIIVCMLYICKIVFGQLYPPGQVTYYDPHYSNLVK